MTTTARNPLAAALAPILVDIARIIRDDGEAVMTLRELLAAVLPASQPAKEPEPEGLLSKQKAAKAIGKSVATLGRLVDEGAPWHPVGDRRMFDLVELRAWLEARGRKPTKAKTHDDDIDVSDILRRHGLRVRIPEGRGTAIGPEP
jgi:hypothetical protein